MPKGGHEHFLTWGYIQALGSHRLSEFTDEFVHHDHGQGP